MLKRLQNASLLVDGKLLDSYVGKYQAPIGVFEISRRGDGIAIRLEGDSAEVHLIPQSSRQFFLAAEGAELTFVTDENGQVTRVVIKVGGETMDARRINGAWSNGH